MPENVDIKQLADLVAKKLRESAPQFDAARLANDVARQLSKGTGAVDIDRVAAAVAARLEARRPRLGETLKGWATVLGLFSIVGYCSYRFGSLEEKLNVRPTSNDISTLLELKIQAHDLNWKALTDANTAAAVNNSATSVTLQQKVDDLTASVSKADQATTRAGTAADNAERKIAALELKIGEATAAANRLDASAKDISASLQSVQVDVRGLQGRSAAMENRLKEIETKLGTMQVTPPK